MATTKKHENYSESKDEEGSKEASTASSPGVPLTDQVLEINGESLRVAGPLSSEMMKERWDEGTLTSQAYVSYVYTASTKNQNEGNTDEELDRESSGSSIVPPLDKFSFVKISELPPNTLFWNESELRAITSSVSPNKQIAEGRPVTAAAAAVGNSEANDELKRCPPERELKWMFRDENGVEHGTFSELQMKQWYIKGWFDAKTPLRRIDLGTDYHALEEYFPQQDSAFNCCNLACSTGATATTATTGNALHKPHRTTHSVAHPAENDLPPLLNFSVSSSSSSTTTTTTSSIPHHTRDNSNTEDAVHMNRDGPLTVSGAMTAKPPQQHSAADFDACNDTIPSESSPSPSPSSSSYISHLSAMRSSSVSSGAAKIRGSNVNNVPTNNSSSDSTSTGPHRQSQTKSTSKSGFRNLGIIGFPRPVKLSRNVSYPTESSSQSPSSSHAPSRSKFFFSSGSSKHDANSSGSIKSKSNSSSNSNGNTTNTNSNSSANGSKDPSTAMKGPHSHMSATHTNPRQSLSVEKSDTLDVSSNATTTTPAAAAVADSADADADSADADATFAFTAPKLQSSKSASAPLDRSAPSSFPSSPVAHMQSNTVNEPVNEPVTETQQQASGNTRRARQFIFPRRGSSSAGEAAVKDQNPTSTSAVSPPFMPTPESNINLNSVSTHSVATGDSLPPSYSELPSDFRLESTLPEPKPSTTATDVSSKTKSMLRSVRESGKRVLGSGSTRANSSKASLSAPSPTRSKSESSQSQFQFQFQSQSLPLPQSYSHLSQNQASFGSQNYASPPTQTRTQKRKQNQTQTQTQTQRQQAQQGYGQNTPAHYRTPSDPASSSSASLSFGSIQGSNLEGHIHAYTHASWPEGAKQSIRNANAVAKSNLDATDGLSNHELRAQLELEQRKNATLQSEMNKVHEYLKTKGISLPEELSQAVSMSAPSAHTDEYELDLDTRPPGTMTQNAFAVKDHKPIADVYRDSPMQRTQIDEKDKDLTVLRDSLKTALKSARVFLSQASSMGNAAEALATNLNRVKMEGMDLNMSSLGDTFRHLSTWTRELVTRLSKPLDQDLGQLVQGQLSEAKAHKRELDKARESFETVEAKCMMYMRSKDKSGKKGRQTATSREIDSQNDDEKIFGELRAMKRQYETARFEMIRIVHLLESKVITDLATVVRESLRALSIYFNQGHSELLSRRNFTEDIGTLAQRYADYYSNLEQNWMVAKQKFEAEILNEHSSFSGQNLTTNNKKPRANSSEKPTGDVDDRLMNILQTDTDVSHAGFLYKRCQNVRKDWRKRWFFIRNGQLQYCRPWDPHRVTQVSNIMLSTVREMKSTGLRNCFEIISPSSRTYVLQASDEQEMRGWIEAVQQAIEYALVERMNSGNIDGDASTTNTSMNAGARFTESTISMLGHGDICAECSAAHPSWASLNLGVMVCIACSGEHRSLGVHVSKIRSMTLDQLSNVHVEILMAIGNDRANAIWEPCHDGDKLDPSCNKAQRKEYIHNKYIAKLYLDMSKMTSLGEMLQSLLDAVKENDLVGILNCVAQGCDLNASLVNRLSKNDREKGFVTALHVAASGSSVACCEFLVLNGADLTIRDNKRRNALEVAISFKNNAVAEHIANKHHEDASEEVVKL